jgi:hypothetical protein
LEQALKEARTSTNPEFAERVKFLQVGLDHARLTLKLTAIHDGFRDVPEERLDEAKEALIKLVQFRKENQHLYFSDLYHVTSYWERRRLNLDYFSGL